MSHTKEVKIVIMISVTHIQNTELQLHFIQCPFPNQIQFGLEKLHPKIAYNFPNQFQFGLERKKWFCKTQIPNQIQIGLENFDDHCLCPENSKTNSVWFWKIIDYWQCWWLRIIHIIQHHHRLVDSSIISVNPTLLHHLVVASTPLHWQRWHLDLHQLLRPTV